jgi:hypothetical protein
MSEEWWYSAFSTADFDNFNQQLESALISISQKGLYPSVSYSHAAKPDGFGYHYSAVVIGTKCPGQPA